MQNKLFSRLGKTLRYYTALILGRVTWGPPPWCLAIYHKARLLSRKALSILLSLIILALFGIYWYKNLPVPVYITADITAPAITPAEVPLKISPLNVQFVSQGTNRSVAPLQKINKILDSGITLTPEAPGTWTWTSDSQLQFVPKLDWPAGQKYTIDFNKKIFTSSTPIYPLSYSFSTSAFEVVIQELKFYQGPLDPKLNQVVGTLQFNYPVNPDSLVQKAHLELQALKNGKQDLKAETFPLTITYDALKRTAYVRSAPLPLFKYGRYLELIIDKGLKPAKGPAETLVNVKKNIFVPNADDFFKITSAQASIVRNTSDAPEQILTLESTLGVLSSAIDAHLHVYLLPTDRPANQMGPSIKNYHWQNPGEVTPDILALSSPIHLQALPPDREYATLHSYKMNLSTPRYILVLIDQGVRSFGDYPLSRPYKMVLPVPEYPKEIRFLHTGALMALNDEKKLSVTVRGLPAVKFTLARVLPNEVNQLVTQTDGRFNDPYFLNYSFNAQNISEIFSEVRPFNPDHLDQLQYTALDFNKYFNTTSKAQGPRGLFLLTAEGWDEKKEISLNVIAKRLILITDCGLITKDNKDGSHEAFVQSITKGTPIVNATVSILGKNGLSILSRTTDTAGHVYFPDLSDFIDDREPTVYLVTNGQDVAFMPFNNRDLQLNASRFDIGGAVSNGLEQSTLSAYLFSDRGIYRPGDTAHIGLIVKEAYAKPQPAGLPLEIRAIDPRGITLQDQKIILGPTGFFTFDINTKNNFSTGQYTVNLFIVKDNRPSSLLGSTTFQVAEFLPDRMRINAHLSKESPMGWTAPDGLKATVSLMNLYGAPAAHRKVTARLLLTPGAIEFPDYPNYIFIDPLLTASIKENKPPKVFTDTLSDTETNAEGQAEFDLKLQRFDQATYHLTFFVEGFEAEGGRSVAAQVSTWVSPLPYFVGYKPDGDLKFIKQNGQRAIHLIAIDPTLQKRTLGPLKLILSVERPLTTLVKKPDGTYQYQSIKQTVPLNDSPLTIDATGTTYQLPTDKIGDFVITVQGPKQTDLCHLRFSVVGTDQKSLPANAELTLKLDQTRYKPGQDMQMEITAPYTGSGYITLERDKVYAYQWFQTQTEHTLQTIKIPNDFVGGGYVNVAFVRNWNSPEIFMSPLSFSIAPFEMDHEEQKIHITLNPLGDARPGQPLSIQYQADRPCQLILFGVDEGILQVAHYKAPDPLGFFFQKRALEVNTQQIMDLILPKFIAERELSAIGGDNGAASSLNKYLNPFKRKTDLPVVFWSGLLQTDGKAHQFNYQVPDYFNGTLRIMVVAASENALGSTEQTKEIQGDFVINPNLPTAVAPGDEFEVTASIANQIKGRMGAMPIKITIQTSPALMLVGPTTQVINIKENQEQNIKIKVRAKDILGPANITFIATAFNYTSQITNSLSVRPASLDRTTVLSLVGKKPQQSLPLSRDLYPEKREVSAVISSSPLIFVMGLQRYLNNYPYGCTEQLVSKAFPLLAMIDRPWFTDQNQKITDEIQATIQMLGQRQLSSGAFSYWPAVGSYQNNAFSSVYAMHFLTEARLHHFQIPADIFNNGINDLKELATAEVTTLDQARIQAYAIYVLTRNELVTTNYLAHLQLYLDENFPTTWHNDLLAIYMAATYELLKSSAEADALLKAYQAPLNKNPSSDFYDRATINAQYFYLIAAHFPRLLNQLDKGALFSLVDTLNSGEINTVLSSYASLALAAFTQDEVTPESHQMSIKETFKDGHQKNVGPTEGRYLKIEVAPNVSQLEFNGTTAPYFYQLTESGFDKKLATNSINQQLEVYREYRNAAGQVLATVPLGDEIEVHVQLRALGDRYLNNIAIVDLLPGGFEVVPNSINMLGLEYSDVREDRVIFFTSIGPNTVEIIYKIRATNRGRYTVPPIFAGSMYDARVQAQSASSTIEVR